MKYLFLLLGVFFCSCSAQKTPAPDIPLMLYYDHFGEYERYSYEWGSGERQKSGYGYVNADTFEIVIPAQYKEASPFQGDLAIVKDFNEKVYLINKNNEKVFKFRSRTSDIKLFTREKDGSVFVSTIEYSRYKLEFEVYFNVSSSPRKRSYRLYNVSTGQRVFKADFDRWGYDRDDDLKITMLDEYIIITSSFYEYDDRVYTVNNKGKLNASTVTAQELLKKSAERQSVSNKEQDSLDVAINIDVLQQNISANMRIVDTIPLDRFSGDSLYSVHIEDSNRESGWGFVGLYDALENKWLINPLWKLSRNTDFKKTVDKNYVHIKYKRDWDSYFNLETGKETPVVEDRDYGGYYKYRYMVYMGYYYEDRYKEEENIYLREPNKNPENYHGGLATNAKINFSEHRNEIQDYFIDNSWEYYCGEMLYYSQAMNELLSMARYSEAPSGIINAVVELYEKTMSLQAPEETEKIYALYGLWGKGHEVYTKFTFMGFVVDLQSWKDFAVKNLSRDKADLELLQKRIDEIKASFPQEEQIWFDPEFYHSIQRYRYEEEETAPV